MIELFLVFFLVISGSEAIASSRKSFLLLEDAALRFQDVIGPELGEAELTIHFDPQDPKVNAELTKQENSLTIRVWGGMLNHRYMTEDALLLLLCHEIGHYLAGPPMKAKGGWSSTEGQADYYSAFKCAPEMGLDEVRFYDGAQALTRIYALATFSPEPRLDQCDPSVVTRTNYGYPSIQCRLDTLLAGWKKLPRPQCWFYQ